ncbi:MAG: peptide deformylase [Pirellulales bacterium]|nr:peptide deformylase [Pirellulales bacterium]
MSMTIVKYPHPTLRHPSKPLVKVDAEVRAMIREMFAVMYENRGVGLAANQVDLPYRMFVGNLKTSADAPDWEVAVINPVIVKRTGTAEAEEGCLSFPDIYAPVRRTAKLTLSGYDPSGKEICLELEGLPARAVQHEIDHLDGVVFIDRLAPAARLAVREPLEALERQFARDRSRGLIPDDQAIHQRLAELESLRT